MQTIKAEITIPIPDDFVLIPKSELEKLKEQELIGTWWTMKDLEKRIGKKQDWIKENILFHPRFREMLDIENGGFVYYPQSKGQPWSFHARKMALFLDEYFHIIFRKKG